MTELKLSFKQENVEKTIEVNQDVFTIGRLPECDLCLPFGGVSRCHARIVKIELDVWTIEDLASKNGTKLNKNYISSPQRLHHSDILCVGEASLTVIIPASKELDWGEIETKEERVTEGKVIFRNVKQLQQRWIQAGSKGDDVQVKDKTIARLKDLVDIAKNLSAAASIEEIFSQVQQVVFRYLKSIDRLALLIDFNNDGKLELTNSAMRKTFEHKDLASDGSWISRSICQRVYDDKIAVQTADAQKDERFAGEHSILIKGIRSAMAVPLWDETKVVGVLYADAHLSSYHWRSEEHTSELQSRETISYAVFCLKKKKKKKK